MDFQNFYELHIHVFCTLVGVRAELGVVVPRLNGTVCQIPPFPAPGVLLYILRRNICIFKNAFEVQDHDLPLAPH